MKRFLAIPAAALMLPLAMVAANGPRDLGTLGGSFSGANAVNFESGVVGSSSTTGDAEIHAFLRICAKENKLVDLGTLSGGTNSTANAINAFYEIVGTSDYNDPSLGVVSHAFKYQPFSGITDLGTLGGSMSQANGVDLEGIIVGVSTTTGESANHAFYSKPHSSGLTDLGTLGGSTFNSVAYAINIKGLVAGSSQTGVSDSFDTPISDAVIWDIVKNTTTDLGTLGGSFAQATAINNFGTVTGSGTTSIDGRLTHAFVSASGKLKDIGTLGGSFAQGTAVNDFGAVVGFSNIKNDADVHAFIWTADRGMVDLNSLLPANSGWVLNIASGINFEGKIVGAGIYKGESHAFVW